MTTTPRVDLRDFRFTAGIDYITISGLTKGPLPSLHGKAIWPASAPGKLTVHDPSRSDINALIETFPWSFIHELEVFVDVWPAKSLTGEQLYKALEAFKAECVAKGHLPRFLSPVNSRFRGAYDPVLKKTVPYNLRVPRADQQLLNGHRNDSEQAKAYLKKRDQRKKLPQTQHRIRLEVRMDMVGSDLHSLVTVEDLIGFKFRKGLMPYFTHVSGSRTKKAGKKSHRSLLLELLRSKRDDFDRPHWERIGVGAFLSGGKRQRPNLTFKRDIALNNRIGQALGRLERLFAAEKFVRLPNIARSGTPAAMRLPAELVKSAMTY